jgi:hypothetical protein
MLNERISNVVAAGTTILLLTGCSARQTSPEFGNDRVHRLPGRIEAEDFRGGPEGIAFHVSLANRAPQAYRPSAVRISTVVPSGFRVTSLSSGDWLAYTVHVAREGAYLLRVRGASIGCGGTFHVEFEGKNVTGPLKFANTCSSDRDWEDIDRDGVTLRAGLQTMRFVVDSNGMSLQTAGNIDFVEILERVGGARETRVSQSSDVELAHPRLFVTDERLAEIRNARRTPRSLHRSVLNDMEDRVRGRMRTDLPRAVAELPAAAELATAEEAALLYLVTQEKAYSEFAFSILRSFLDDARRTRVLIPQRASEFTELPLERSAVGMAFGITYDWCFNAWTAEQRITVRKAIEQALDSWACVGHRGLESPFDTPFFGAFRGAELVMTAAIGGDRRRQNRFMQLRRWLVAHVENGYSESGLASTGADVDVAGAFLLPAAYALEQIGDPELLRMVSRKSWWKLAMVADLMRDIRFANDPPHAGWRNLLFRTVPQEYIPYYRWAYDHSIGKDATAPTYDGDQAGAVWAVLFYPESVESRDPRDTIPTFVADRTIGAFIWRSDWREKQPVVFEAFADSSESESQLDLPRAFSLVLRAGIDTLIKELPPKSDQTSNLLVDGRSFDMEHRHTIGRVDQYREGPRNTTTVGIDGTAKFSRLGLGSAHRLVWVDRRPANGSSMIWSTLDRIHSTAEHEYAWQINIGTIGNAVVDISSRQGSTVPHFLARWPSGTGLEGWVLSPERAVVELEKCTQCGANSDQLLRVTTKGTNTAIWLVVAVSSNGRATTASVSGSGLSSVIDIDGTTVRFDEKQRAIVEEGHGRPLRRSGQFR